MKNTKNIRNSKTNITRGMFLSMLLIGPGQYLHAGLALSRQLINRNIWEELVKACNDENVLEVQRLLATPSSIDINKFYKEKTLLHHATDKRNAEMVRMLLTVPNIDVNKLHKSYGCTPLWDALHYGLSDIAKMLLEMPSIDVNAAKFGNSTCLGHASLLGDIETVKRLLEIPGIDLNKANCSGDTPLSEASSFGRTPIVELLIAHGADINKANNDGATALMQASLRGHIAIVELLIAHGADQSQVDLAQVTNVDCRNAVQEAKAVWNHRDKFCQADRDGNINLLEYSKLLTAIKALNPDDHQLIIDTYSNIDQAKIDAVIKEHQCSIMDAQIMAPIIEITQKYLNLLNASDYAKDRLKTRHHSELSNHPDIKTVKTLLARRSYEGKADGSSLQNGSIHKLPIDLLPYIGSLLAPDEQTLLDPLLAKRSHAIRNRLHDEIIVDEDTTAALADTEYEAAVNRLKQSLTCSQDGNGNVSDAQDCESIVRKRK